MKPHPFLILIALCAGCQSLAPNDGWRHIGWSPTTSALYVKGDYAIAEAGRRHVLLYRPDGQYIRVGEFKTLDLAKGAAK